VSLEPALLRGRERWERVVEGWTDSTHDDAFTHTVRLHEPEHALELTAVALPSPTYEIREARCRVLAGAVADPVAQGAAKLAGLRMTAGFTRAVAGAVGPGEGAPLVVEAAVEVARLARQVTRLPRERAERAALGAWECWQLDTTGWVDLPGSCFAYGPAGRALFATRAVTTPMHPDLYSPRPGQMRVFERRKVARLERRDGRLLLFHSMHDNVHGFEVTYEVDAATGRIVRAEHVTPRLPYTGICTEPQARIASLVGETVDPGFRRRLGTLVGGPEGCAQLYDLTADLFKLLAA
jgi:hypothetical protein